MNADEALDCLHVFEARIRPLSEIEGTTYMKQLKNPADHFREDEVLSAIGVIADRKTRGAEEGRTNYRYTMDDVIRIVVQERRAAASRPKPTRAEDDIVSAEAWRQMCREVRGEIGK